MELEQVQGTKKSAGWVPNSEEERRKSKTRVMRPEGFRAWVTTGKAGGGGDDQNNQCGGEEQKQVQDTG